MRTQNRIILIASALIIGMASLALPRSVGKMADKEAAVKPAEIIRQAVNT